MDSSEIYQQRDLIEDVVKQLQQSVKFLYQGYDYHQNNELNILDKQLGRLFRAKEELHGTRDAYNELISKLETAKQKHREILELLQIYKKIDETDEDDKENSQGRDEN